MERKIMIIDSAANKRITVATDAEKFGDLKAAVRAAGISIEGKDWLEGLTQTRPVSDESILPSNVSYKGTTTNDLVYMLTNTNKYTKSGSMTRAEAYSFIKSHNLTSAVKEAYGKNYTNCTTAQLIEFVEVGNNVGTTEVTKVTASKKCECVAHKEYDALVKAVASFLIAIEANPEVSNKVQEAYTAIVEKDHVESVDFSSEDIENMFRGVNA